MTPTAAEVADLLSSAIDLPYSRARSTALEQAVAAADACPDPEARQMRVRGRLALVGSYIYGGGEHPRMYTPFTWALRQFDAHPEDFDDYARHTLLWHFKDATIGMTAYPEVPLSRIDAALDDMERRYRALGQGLAPVLGARYGVAVRVHGHEAAAEAYAAWVAAPRTRLSDCAACEPTARCHFLAGVGRDEDAIATVAEVLHGEASCSAQPQSALAAVLLPMVRTGRLAEARDAHVRGLRAARQLDPEDTLPEHLRFCALTGNEARGLDVLEEHLTLVDTCARPADRRDLAAAGALLLRRLMDQGHGERLVRPAAGPAETVAALHQRLERAALDLATAFDARNGTAVIGDWVRATLSAQPLAHVPLGGVSRPLTPRAPTGLAGSTTGDARPRPAADVASDLDDLPPLQLAERYADALRTGTVADARAVVTAYDGRRDALLAAAPGAEPDVQRALARLEGARSRALAGGQLGDPRPEEAREGFLTAARMADQSGAAAESLLYHLWVALVDADSGDAGALARATELQAQVLEIGTPDEQARSCSRLAVVAQVAGNSERERHALLDGVRLSEGATDADLLGTRAGLLVRLAELELHAENAEAAATAARAALAAAAPGTWLSLRAEALGLLGFVLPDPAEAAELLGQAAEEAERAGQPDRAAWTRARQGRALLESGEPQSAARVLTDVVADVDRLLAPGAGAAVRLDLAIALREAQRPEESAEVAQLGLRMLDPDADHWLRGALGHHAAVAAFDLEDYAEALRLAKDSAAAHRTNGTPAGAAESLRIAALATERLEDPSSAAELWRRTADAAAEGELPLLSVLALRCLALPLAVQGDRWAAEAAIEEAEQRLAGLELPVEDATWQSACQDEQRLRVAMLTEHPVDGIEPGLRAMNAFEQVGDERSAVEVRARLARALVEADRLADALQLLTDGADAALARDDADSARALGGELARALDEAGRATEADKAWQRYSGED